MTSPGEDLQSWSTVANNNGTADPLINWQEGQTRKSVNNSSRSEMAAHAKARNLLNGTIVTTGSKNAQAFISGIGYTGAIPTGLRVLLKVGAGLDNDGPTTLNMDGLGDTIVKRPDLTDTIGGEFKSSCFVDLIYNGTFWVNLFSPGNIAPVTSPEFEGDPQAPTPPDPNDRDNSIATTEWVQNLVFGGQGIVLAIKTFATPGTATYTPSAGMKTCLIECVGGGGGGGSGVNDHPTDPFLIQGGGGGAGGYSRKLATATAIGASQTVTVGGGGGANGGPGGGSSVGTLCVANGGGGGPNNNSVNFAGGGAGGAPGVGDITGAGAPGEGGTYLFFSSSPGTGSQQFDCATGGGGSSIFGGGAPATLIGAGGSPQNGNPGGNYGSGGGGGAAGIYGQFGNGGPGSGGIVIITEFAGAGVPGAPGLQGPPGPQGPAGPAGPGTGNVIVSGTPSAGQYAVWTDTSHIQGTAAPPSGFSTGDVKLTLKNAADSGWIMMNDQTIGDATSGATFHDPTAQALFTLLWSNIPDAWCPVLPGGRGASAAADWGAHKTLKLPRTLGRALAAAGAGAGLTSRALGEVLGAETVGVPLPQHNHSVTDPGHAHAFGGYNLNVQASYTTVDPGSNYNASLWGGFVGVTSNGVTGISVQNAGTAGASMNVVQPTSFLNVMIKL